MLPATYCNRFKGMLEFTSMHGIMIVNFTSTCMHVIVNNNYLNILKFRVHTISSCFVYVKPLSLCRMIFAWNNILQRTPENGE